MFYFQIDHYTELLLFHTYLKKMYDLVTNYNNKNCFIWQMQIKKGFSTSFQLSCLYFIYFIIYSY